VTNTTSIVFHTFNYSEQVGGHTLALLCLRSSCDKQISLMLKATF